MTTYRKTMREALEEMHDSLNEDNMDLLSKAAGGAMQTLKMKDGKLQLDSFTASAIKKVYDKVNPANQKKMSDMINNGTKSSIMKLQDFVMKQIKSSYNEEADLDEGTWATPDTPKEKAALKKLLSKPLKAKDAEDKLYDLVGDDEMYDDLGDYADKNPNDDVRAMVKSHMKRLGIKEEADLDEKSRQLKDPKKEVMVVKKGEVIVIDKKDQDNYMKKGWKLAEGNDLDEASVNIESLPFKSLMDVVNDMMKQLPKSDKKNYEKEVAKVLKTMGVKSEEADLDEATKWKMGDGKPRGGSNIENVRFWDLSKDELQYIMKDAGAAMKANPTAKKATSGPGNYADQVNDATTVLGWRKKNGIKEDVELDELMPATKHVAKSKKNPDMFCVFDKDGNEVKLFKDKKDAEEYAIKNHDALNEAKIDPTVAPKSAKVIGNKEDGYRLRMFFPDGHDETLPEIGRPDMNGLKSIIDKNILKHKKGIRKSWIPVVSAAMKKKPIDEGAAADARRAMSKDKDFSRRDSADDDTAATDDDVKAASKNILMQLRKAISLKSFNVEFGDGKHKVDAKIAQAVQNKYNTMRRPADKEKYQMQIAKSYKGMLQSLKAGYHGEQKESILSRIDRKLKERKNG
jgi:hypothetical protein